MDTLAVLANSKAVFLGRSERGALALRLNQLLVRGKIVDWLEVGAGDGKNLTYLLDEVGDGRRFDVTAIDPSPMAVKRIRSQHPIEVLSAKIENFRPKKSYDCINARQSVYYLEDPARSLAAFAGWLTQEGVLAVTLWSQDCILYELNRAVARVAGRDDTGLHAEDLIEALPPKEFIVERHRESCGGLDTERLRIDRSAFASLCALVARKIDITAFTEKNLAELFAHLERLAEAQVERSNDLLFVRRRC